MSISIIAIAAALKSSDENTVFSNLDKFHAHLARCRAIAPLVYSSEQYPLNPIEHLEAGLALKMDEWPLGKVTPTTVTPAQAGVHTTLETDYD